LQQAQHAAGARGAKLPAAPDRVDQLDLAEPARARLDVLVDLVDALACEGHYAQAERLAKDGLALATELDDAAATARLRDPVLALVSVEAPATLFTAPYLFARTRAGTRG